VVDNGSNLSEGEVKHLINDCVILRNPCNLGFAGGCNVGLRYSDAPYVVLLNNDTQVTRGWLSRLVEVMEEDRRIGVCQPKLLSLRYPGHFDYAGGMGGLIDLLGYPFAIGRLFKKLEPDRGQYDGRYDIFWASGTACMIRRSVLDEVGLLDEEFFAHMEEIDLNWRMQLAGYRVVSTSESVVYHQSGWTLAHESFRKIYLNHRNNWVMLLKNYQAANLLWIVPWRLLLDVLTIGASLLMGQWKRAWAVLRAFFYILTHLGPIVRKRLATQKLRRVSDSLLTRRMYRGSVVLQHFVWGKWQTRSLKGALHPWR